MQSYQIVELNFDEIDSIGGGPLPFVLLAPAAWAALEGITIGLGIYGGIKAIL